MSKGLKGITVKIDGDTQPLNKALSKINAESKSLSGELKGVNTLLKFDPKNTELLAQKQTVLSQAIEQTESKLKTLTQAQQQMAEAGKNADNSAEYRDLQREIAATQQKLASYNTQLKNTESQQKQAAKEAETLGQKIYKIASHIPIVNKLADGFVKTKQKITETVKESAAVQKIGSAVEGARQKVEAFKNSHPHVKKVADAFHTMKEKADELKSKLPTLQQSLAEVGNAAAGAAKGGFKALEVTIGGTVKAFAAFSTAALTAGAGIAKNAVESYADYEQFVGGVETLFGAGGQSLGEYAKSVGKTTADAKKEYESLMKAQETVLKNADNAYKTAGLSANEYMETVTGFSAALISSMGGDTEAAAKKADMAITDMADNANKMGSDMSSIQTAYQGFAKQNYTMLDNLKLGYGGTKEEMQRLLEDATKLSGVKYDISSYADIVDAIHVVQTEMGITGTTAKEASETISGSIGAAKSAWQNLMTGLADENADLDGLIDNMADSALTVVDNVLPRVMETVPRIVEAVPKLIEGLSAAFAGIAGQLGGLVDQLLPPLMQAFFTLIRTITGALPTLLPQILNAAVTLFGGLLQGLNETIPQLLAMLPEIIQILSQTLIDNLPQLITAGVQILVNLISGITQSIPTLISAIIELIPVIVQAVTENLPLIIEAGINLLMALINGIVQAIPQLTQMLPTVINTIVSTIITMLPQILEAGIQILNALVSGIVQAIPQLVAMLPQVISSTVNTLVQNLPKIIQTGIELIGALISGIIQAIPSLVAAIPQVIKAIFETFKAVDWGELGKNIIDGIITGVKNAASSLIEVFKDLAKSALDAVKDFFKIKSPSRVMRDQVGKMLPAGIAEGVEDGMDEEEKRIKAAMARAVPTTIDGYIKAGGSRAGVDSTQAVTGGGFVQNLTINSQRELSPSETARLNKIAMQQTILRIKRA
ncbi:MAG: hypothetical protein HDR09_20045 [Lachnospiraceae bacterium]|nr:hypothetical protein [Lachnospiraceae bacterium]MBD5505968.1 hypothetical protein [Lachnospiraceae bacterium]